MVASLSLPPISILGKFAESAAKASMETERNSIFKEPWTNLQAKNKVQPRVDKVVNAGNRIVYSGHLITLKSNTTFYLQP